MPEMTQATDQPRMRYGQDFVCPNCNCEIMLKHPGDQAKTPNMQPFTCCCGTRMVPEHASGRS